MATSGYIYGRDWIVQSNTTQITGITGWDLTVGHTKVDVTTADSSGNWIEKLPLDKEWSLTVNFLLKFDASEGFDEIYDDLNNQSSVAILITTGVSGDTTLGGNAYADISCSAPRDGIVAVTANYEGTGALTKSTVGA